jgi:hypothetical protein
MQGANRAAAQSGGVLIRKMRPFEKCHTFACRTAGKTAMAHPAYIRRDLAAVSVVRLNMFYPIIFIGFLN